MPLNAGKPKVGLRGPPSTQHRTETVMLLYPLWDREDADTKNTDKKLQRASPNTERNFVTHYRPGLDMRETRPPTCEVQGAFLEDFTLQLSL